MPNHQHGPGFHVDNGTLGFHLIYDHGLTREEVDALEDVDVEEIGVWHTAQHAEIGAEPAEPDIEALAQQIIGLQDVVDQLILNDLLDL